MGEGDGKSRRRGDARLRLRGFGERHLFHIRRGGSLPAARTSRLSDHFRPPRPAVPGVRGFLSADFMLSELSLCRMGRPWSAWDRAARFATSPSLPPAVVPRKTRAPEIGCRNGPRPNVSSVRFESATARGWQTRSTNIRVKDAQSTLRARARAFPSRVLTSASGCTPPRTSDASPAVPPATPEIEDLIPIHPRPRR